MGEHYDQGSSFATGVETPGVIQQMPWKHDRIGEKRPRRSPLLSYSMPEDICPRATAISGRLLAQTFGG